MAMAPVLCEDLVVEILSWLPVKALMRFSCVSKAWETLIFSPTFVKLQLQRASKNTHTLLHFLAFMRGDKLDMPAGTTLCSNRSLLEDTSSTVVDCGFQYFDRTYSFLGSCNGLVCLLDCVFGEHWIRFWNPATGTMSDGSPCGYEVEHDFFAYGLGYDDWSDTYKVMLIRRDVEKQELDMRLHCMGDTCWRKILTCPAFPIFEGIGRFVSGTLNWLALHNMSFDYQWGTVTLSNLVIFSFDLKSESYRHLLMPEGLLEVPFIEPRLGDLKGCLCLYTDQKGTHFVVWLMMEFAIEKSWTQLLNVSYEHIQTQNFSANYIVIVCMSENDDVLLLADNVTRKFIIYDRRENRIKRTEDFSDSILFFWSCGYVESLVSPC